MIDRVIRAIRRRPVRVAEAVVALAALAGYVVAPEVQEGITVLVVAFLAVIGGEAAQRKTTPIAAPSLPDCHADEGHPDYDPRIDG